MINFVPQQEAWVIERMGKFHRILQPGMNFLLPCIDNIKYIHTLKEITIEIPQQDAITLDNVQLDLDAVLYIRVVDPYKASYGVQNPEYAIAQLAMTVMRAEVGKLLLDNVFRERANLNMAIVEGIKDASEPWGIVCLRYEIRTMNMPPEIQKAMKMQVEAERKKRAMILESEGLRQSEMNKAEGEKQSRILRSEAAMQEDVNKATAAAKAAESEKLSRILESEAEMQSRINMAKAQAQAAESEKIQNILASEAEKQALINRAAGQAQAIQMEFDARCKALEELATTLDNRGADDAASFVIADNYVKAFGNLAKTNNSIIIPSNPSDVGSMVAQAMTIYKQVSNKP
uniref:Band 7 domain-containing protein n=1 Tax=Acrobeloides nanus TaxID=290746 RepID=A0A914CN81_9BILA